MNQNPPTDEQLGQIEARAAAASKGPWTLAYEYCDCSENCGHGLYVSRINTGAGPATELGDLPRSEWELMVHAREDVDVLLAEVRRQRDELAETKALNDPRLRGLLVKAAPDKDLYVQWSTVCDMPGGVFSRETALEYGFPRSKVDHADKHGSSSRIGDGAWDDKGWVAEQRGWLRRDRIGDYAIEYLTGDREAAYALLEPFDDEPAPVAAVSSAAENGDQP